MMMMKKTVLVPAALLAALALTPAYAEKDSTAAVEVKAEASADGAKAPSFGQRLKNFFGLDKDQGTQVTDQTKRESDKTKAKGKATAEAAKDEAQGQSEAAQEHAAEVKAEGQAKAESAKDDGSKQGASDSAKEEGDNRQGEGLSIGSEIKIDASAGGKQK